MMSEQSRVEDLLPLSPLQRGLLYHALFDERAQDVYTMQFLVELDGPVDGDRFRAAADALLARHANLRAAFLSENLDEPVQVVVQDATAPWTEVDLSHVDEESGRAELARLAEADRQERFDLLDPPLLRFALVCLGARRHALVLTNHHLLLDGWSVPLLMRELLELYGAGADASALPAVRPYRDFLAWLASRDREAAERAWRSALSGVDEPTLLARGRNPSAPAVPETTELRLSEELTAELRALAASRRVTVNTVVQGLWGLLLARLTGREDVVFGATVSGRPSDLDGAESMIGLFINTVPVRMLIRSGEAVTGALRRLQDEQSSLIEHHHCGLGEIQRAAGPAGGQGGELFDTLVVFENYPLDTEAVTQDSANAGVRVTGWEASGGTHYPLTLAVFDERELTVVFERRPDVFDRAVVEKIAERFRGLVEQITAEPDRPVGQLLALTEDEREWLLSVATAAPVAPRPTLLPEALEERASRAPEAAAVVAAEGLLTFGELNARANRLARLLIGRGAGPEGVVAVALPPVSEAIVALLAVLKSGAAYLPVDPAWPDERVDAVLADAQPLLLITRGGQVGGSVEALDIDDALDEGRAFSGADVTDADRTAPLLPQHLAYVIYTSGSTGEPKAVAVAHRSIANLLAAHRAALFDPAAERAGRPLRAGHAWPLAFDASWQPTLWMFAGHELHLVPLQVRRDPAALVAFLAARGIEFIELSPALLSEVVAEPGWRGSLRVLAVGGEAVPPELWQQLRAEEGLVVHNLYGPTECAVDAADCDLARSDGPSIGGPVAGDRTYVLDRHLNLVPAGVEGELYIGGAGVARGYLRRAAATAERFVADPFAGSGERMYRTGDVARWRPDGLLECLGRVDDQVKIRGYRVDPGEVELALLRHERVERVAVVAREDTPGVRRLVAYVVPPVGDGADDLAAQLRVFIADLLPEYMIPAAIVAVEGFPLTRNEKLDVSALPEPEWTTRAPDQPPRNRAEQLVAELFAEVLGAESVGVHENFFALGGDSILSMRLVSRARSAGLRISPRDVFDRPTVAELAADTGALDDRTDEGPRDGQVPLTPMLARLASQGSTSPGTCQASALPVPSDVDGAAVEDAVASLVDRHDVLRASFGPDADGQWHFTIAPRETADVPVRSFDAAHLGDEELRELVSRAFREAAAELDPGGGTVARFVHFGRSAGESGTLLVVLHHAVVDAISWSILRADLDELWRAPGGGGDLAPAGTSFRRWAEGLRDAANSEARSAELVLWRDVLTGPDPVLGAGRTDPDQDLMSEVRSARTELGADLSSFVAEELPEARGVGVEEVLLVGLSLAVARWRRARGWAADETSVLISLQRHGREEQVVDGADLSGTVGWFSTAHPVRLDPGDAPVEDQIRHVGQQLAAPPDRGIGYGLLRHVNPGTSEELRHLDEPQIQFNYLGRDSSGSAAEQHSAADPAAPVPHSLLVEALVSADGTGAPAVATTWRWPWRIFTAADVDELSEQWVAALEGLRKGDHR